MHGLINFAIWGVVIQVKAIFWFFGLVFRLFGLMRTEKKKELEAFDMPFASRLEHELITAGSGHGKTQMIQSNFVRYDLEKVIAGERSCIIIDSQGDMLRKITSIAELAPGKPLSERVIIIDPNDIEYPPALNLFDFGLSRLENYSPLERERMVNGAIALYEYIFGALLGAELTNRQGVIFRYLARLLMVIPGATIYTLMEFMEHPESVRPYLHKLDPATERFLTTQLFAPSFETTRQQILTRLWGVLSNPVLARMFSHTHNKLNLFEAMNNGSLIIINTAKDLLKQEGCEIFGRFMISLIAQATQERSAIPENKRKPTFVYIDEAADYFRESDPNLEQLLTSARKYKVGIILAIQNLTQLERRLQATILASTAIKLAGGVSAGDAATLGKEMKADPEYIQSMQKTAEYTQFAIFVRNVSPVVFGLQTQLGELERLPTMQEEERIALLADNRRRFCAPPETPRFTASPRNGAQGVGFDLEKPAAL